MVDELKELDSIRRKSSGNLSGRDYGQNKRVTQDQEVAFEKIDNAVRRIMKEAHENSSNS